MRLLPTDTADALLGVGGEEARGSSHVVEQATRRNLATQELHGAVSLPWWEGQVHSHTLVVGLLKWDRTEGCHSLVSEISSLLDEQGL